MSFNETLREMLRRNEGVRAKAYADSLGIPTIGVGFNLRRPDARARIEAVGANYVDIMARRSTLTAGQIDALLDQDIGDCLADLRKLFENFEGMPEAVRLVLVDMRFQLGPAGLRGFRNTLRAFRDRRWKDAAAGMRASLAYRQTPVRWERNAKALESV
jgi:lysozyme